MTGVGMTLLFCWFLGCFVCFRRGKRIQLNSTTTNPSNNDNAHNNNSISNSNIESTSRVICVSLIAFWELVASGTNSLLMSQNILNPNNRGLTIVLISSSTIIVRITQIIYYKHKLYNIASKEQMIVEKKKLLNKEKKDIDENIVDDHDKQIEMAIRLQSFEFEFDKNNIDDNNINNNSSEFGDGHSVNDDDNDIVYSNAHDGNKSEDMTNVQFKFELSQELENERNEFKKRTKESKKLKEEEASKLFNYNFALYFISFSTFTDGSFDIIQGIILLFGFTSTTQPLAVLGSLIGFSTEIMDFFEGM